MADGGDIPDSSFLNFQNTVSDIERALARSSSKRRGVRGDDNSDGRTLATNLKQDMISIVESPLSQPKRLQSISELSADGIEALRALHFMVEAMVKEGRDQEKDKNLEAMVEVAVKLLRNPNLKMEAAVVEEKDDESSGAGPDDLKARRSKRLAELSKNSYNETDDPDLFEVEGGEETDGTESENADMANT